MTFDIDWQRVVAGAALVFAAVLCGLAAGIDPLVSIYAAIGIAFLVIAFTDLSMGLAALVFASFVTIYNYSIYDVAARGILALAWLVYVLTRGRKELDFQLVYRGPAAPWCSSSGGATSAPPGHRTQGRRFSRRPSTRSARCSC